MWGSKILEGTLPAPVSTGEAVGQAAAPGPWRICGGKWVVRRTCLRPQGRSGPIRCLGRYFPKLPSPKPLI